MTPSSPLSTVFSATLEERLRAVQQLASDRLCAPVDTAVGISTSANSAGLLKTSELGAYTFAMAGATGGKVLHLADDCLRVDSLDASRVQEAHILAGNMLCDAIVNSLCTDQAERSHQAVHA
jgi:D-sedoheptulose 7-phosphate isomerase